MTISAPNFTRLQDGIKFVDDLRVRGPLNVALAYLGGNLVTQLNSHFGAVSTSISAQIASLLASTNLWTGTNQFSAPVTISLSAGSSPLTLITSEPGATGARIINRHHSPTPAVNDVPFSLIAIARDSQGTDITTGQIRSILDNTSATTASAHWDFVTVNAGASAVRMLVGAGVAIGNPTGGDQGAGTLNLDNALFRDGTQVVGTRVTGWGDPFGAISRATISVTTVTTAALASFVAAMYADLKAHGLIGN